MSKSTITLQLPTKLFDPEAYYPMPTHNMGRNRNEYKLFNSAFVFKVYGSNTIHENDWLMPLCYIDYAQITILLDLNILISSYLPGIKDPYRSAILGVHQNPFHESIISVSIR